MLVRVLLLVAFATALVEALVLGAAAMARANIAHRASDLAASAALDATARAQAALASAIGANGGVLVLPSSPPTPALTCLRIGDSACALMASASMHFTLAASPTATPGASPCACTTFTQANDRVDEARANATIAIAVTNAAGAPVSHRNLTARFRTMAVPPYAVLSGSLDATSDGLAGNGVGDDGGESGSDGTLIDVVYKNATTGVQTPANVWQAHSVSEAPASQPWDP